MTKVPTPVKSSDIEGRPEAEMTSDEPQSKSPETSFRVEERPSSAADCLTPSRARLMDEINEVYEVHARSLPRHTKIITKNSSANLLSLKEYRREMMEKSVPNASTVESVLIPTDECDSSSNQNPTDVDKKKQIQNLVSIYSAQHDQAQKALRYTMDKMDRDEEEFIEANHVLLTHRVALEAARRMQNSLEKNASKNVPRMKSAFTFNSVTFELDAEFLHEICLDGSSCFFTVVISHNETSRCSPYTSYRANNKRRLTVEIYSILNDVKPDFEIYVEVYMLKINKNNSEKRNAFAEVVGTLLRNDRHGVRRQEYRTSEPRFERVGVAVINSSNMRSRYISAETVQYVAPRFEVNFEHQLVESDYFVEGYLRRFELLAGVGNWSMEYMSFKNWFLESWITHREKQEGKPSIRSVNLRRCLDVSEVEDSASYPFSFMLTYSTEVNKTEKMTLAARSKEEYDQWFKLFNEFVSGLRYWS
ncbi:hypothetical protein M3Y94_00323800 [Aphelenchoides besseyi]|nr:hypothetical protein M3Y94_00323800 [Aphelenchoides besseyi]